MAWFFKSAKNYDSIIEGTSKGDSFDINYKAARLNIPDRASTVNDGARIYILYCTTKDFNTIMPAESGKGIDAKVEDLSLCMGIIVTPKRENQGSIEIPRAIFTRKGKIFVEKSHFVEHSYLDNMLLMLWAAKGIFEDKRAAEMYRKLQEDRE